MALQENRTIVRMRLSDVVSPFASDTIVSQVRNSTRLHFERHFRTITWRGKEKESASDQVSAKACPSSWEGEKHRSEILLIPASSAAIIKPNGGQQSDRFKGVVSLSLFTWRDKSLRQVTRTRIVSLARERRRRLSCPNNNLLIARDSRLALLGAARRRRPPLAMATRVFVHSLQVDKSVRITGRKKASTVVKRSFLPSFLPR